MTFSGTPAQAADLEPRLQLLEAPVVHAALAAVDALAASHKDRAAPRTDLGQIERLLDPQPGAPQQDNHRSHATAVTVFGGVSHDRHDLLHLRRVGRVPHPLVARRPAGVIAGHGRGRATPPGGIENGRAVMGSSSQSHSGQSRCSTSARADREADGPR
jgi:hypothetical protein